MNDNRPGTEEFIGRLLVLIGAAGVIMVLGLLVLFRQDDVIWPVLLGVICLVLVAAFDLARRQRRQNRRRKPADAPPTVTDLGLLAYTAPRNPVVYRQGALPEGTRTLRPFAVLMLRRASYCTFRFEVRDGSGVPVLVDEFRRRLNARESLVVADRWLPLDGTPDVTAWTLELHVDGTLLTVHDFRLDDGGGTLRAHLSGDGELSDELVAALAEEDTLTLGELLGG
ncbi:MAG: hypothetical protein JW910_18085 [Anaerolineae bacterium]|nr:hypothetical protein [Anaerolineae bacterium]